MIAKISSGLHTQLHMHMNVHTHEHTHVYKIYIKYSQDAENLYSIIKVLISPALINVVSFVDQTYMTTEPLLSY